MVDIEIPLLSVITPVFNGSEFLKETLESLLASDYPNIEFIVLDDGSTDNSAEIAEKVLAASNRPFRLIKKENTGEADTDNQGLAAAIGKYIAIVNCDDPVFPSLFSAAVNYLEENTEIVVTYPDWDMIDRFGVRIKTIEVPEYSIDALLGDNRCLPGPGAVIRRSAIKSKILRDPKFRYTSDYRQWLNLSLEGDFARIPKTLCTFRVHSAQQTYAAAGIVQAQEMIRCIEDFYATTATNQVHARLKNQALSQSYYLAALQSLQRSGVPGRRYLLKSLTLPFRRNPVYKAQRRSAIAMAMVLVNPLGRLVYSASRRATRGQTSR